MGGDTLIYSNSDRFQYYSSHSSLSNSDPGHSYGSTRGMGPPPLDFPPQPVEIDVNSSRTLPSPSSSLNWDPALLQSTGYGDMPPAYGTPSITRAQQLPHGNQARSQAQDPITNWYIGNDGPWIPKGISEVGPEERLQSRGQTGNRTSLPFGGQYRQTNPSENGTYQYGVPPSDSGYGTRRSIGTASVFGADIAERDQDCQSLAGHMGDFQPFQPMNEVLQAHDARTNELWPQTVPAAPKIDSNGLRCRTCSKPVKTRSELKKHDLRHRKPFMCKVEGCSRAEGFSTTNDLDRHIKSKHPSSIPESEATKMYRCYVVGCKSKDKAWPRLDNFKSHLKRVHPQLLQNDDEFEAIVKRAETLERPALSNMSTDRNGLSSKQANQDDSPRGPERPETVSELGVSGFHSSMNPWNRDEQSQDFMAPKGTPSEEFDRKTASPEACPSDGQPCDTVEPKEIYKGKITLESVVSSPVGLNDAVIKKNDRTSLQPPASKKINPGKAARQNDVSAPDATITEVIRNALAGPTIPERGNDNILAPCWERNSLPDAKCSGISSGSNLATTSIRQPDNPVNPADHASKGEDPKDSEAQRKAIEVLKTLYELGYIVQRDPSFSPKVQNSGSAASNRSDHQVTCGTCKKFKGRPCELKKHMKRHERPYGCTFLTCNKVFGSKNDWKRHENSQHFQLETWRCDQEKPEGGACAKVCYRRQTFKDHLSKEHQIIDVDTVKIKVETRRIGRNCQARFYCGFCVDLIDLKNKGLDAWTERFNHIDDHFMGRNGRAEQRIQEWVPMDGDKPKGTASSPCSLDPSPPSKDGHDVPFDRSPAGSSPGSSPDTTGASKGVSAQATIHEGKHQEPSKKRRINDDGSDKPAKHAKTTIPFEIINCCHCGAEHTTKISENCVYCESGHKFCLDCPRSWRYAAPEL